MSAIPTERDLQALSREQLERAYIELCVRVTKLEQRVGSVPAEEARAHNPRGRPAPELPAPQKAPPHEAPKSARR